MNQRKQLLIKKIVEEYTKKAEPVSSGLLVDNFNLSSATLRNEMAALEKDGYVYQPHISAGRIPSEKGFNFYIETFLKKDQNPSQKNQDHLNTSYSFEKENVQRKIKNLAKQLAELSGQTVLIGFEPNDVYYTGLSNLFSKPEFANPEQVYNLSLVIDHLDNAMSDIHEEVASEIEILVGKNNPFGHDCSVLLTKFKSSGRDSLIGLLGPMRMDYQNNYNLLNYSKNLLTSNN